MLRKLLMAAAASAVALGAAFPATADARPDDRGSYDRGRGYDRDRSGYGRGYDGRGYYDNGRRSYGRCRNNGAAGTVIGAIAGGLLGNSIVGGRDRTGGTIVGAGVGALAGRAIDRDC